MKVNYQVLVRYLLAFLLFASLLLLLFVPIWYYVFNFTMKNELAYMEDKLNSGIAVIDSTVTALNNAMTVIADNSQFRSFRYRARESYFEDPNISPYFLREMTHTFNSLLSSNSLLADAGILSSGDLCLTRHRIFFYPDSNVFYGIFFSCGELSKDEWLALLSGKRSILPVSSYQSVDYGAYDALTFSMSWSYGDYSDANIIFATLPIDKIISLIADDEVAKQGRIDLVKASGEVLFSQGVTGALSERCQGIIKDKKFHVIRDRSLVNDIQFEISVPDTLMKQKMRPVRNLILFFTAITAIVTIFLSLMFAWQSTKPMQAFLDTFDSTRIIRLEYERFKKKLSLSPFKSFRQMFNDIGERISLADKELENSLHIIKHETQILRVGMADKIQEALESGNAAAACTILQETASALPEPEDPQISGLIANLLAGMHEKLKRKFPDILGDLEIPGYTVGGQNVYFDQLLPEYFRKIDELLKVHREREITKFDRAVLDFINEHLYDPELYITMVSDRFKISAPSIQKLIKKVSGQTFLVYVENLRLSRACEILSITGHTVTETAALCGFSNANSFSRAFKRVYGFSPSRIINGNIRFSSAR